MNKFNREIKKIREIARLHGITVDVRYHRHGTYYSGLAYGPENRVVISITHLTNRRNLFSTACHEIAHVVCYQTKRFYAYHTFYTHAKPSSEMIEAVRYTALKAERYVDRMGERIMRKHFPAFRYRRAYRSKKDIRWLYRVIPTVFGVRNG